MNQDCTSENGHEWKTNVHGRKSCKHCGLLYIMSKEASIERAKVQECTCAETEYDYHPCPFTVEVYGITNEEECNCCPYCTEQCWQSV